MDLCQSLQIPHESPEIFVNLYETLQILVHPTNPHGFHMSPYVSM